MQKFIEQNKESYKAWIIKKRENKMAWFLKHPVVKE